MENSNLQIRKGTDLNESQYKDKLKQWEGDCNYFYTDTKGLVTCGIGALIDPLVTTGFAKLHKLEFYELFDTMYFNNPLNLNFKVDSNPKITIFRYSDYPSKIIDSFFLIKNLRVGWTKAWKCTPLRITESSYLKLFNEDYEKQKNIAIRYYSKYGNFKDLPLNIQWALIDISYNSDISKFVRMGEYLHKREYANAALESARKGIQDDRNATIFYWISMYDNAVIGNDNTMNNIV